MAIRSSRAIAARMRSRQPTYREAERIVQVVERGGKKPPRQIDISEPAKHPGGRNGRDPSSRTISCAGHRHTRGIARGVNLRSVVHPFSSRFRFVFTSGAIRMPAR